MLVDSVANIHLLDHKEIPELKERMKHYEPLDEPKTIVTVGKNELRGTAEGILYGTIGDHVRFYSASKVGGSTPGGGGIDPGMLVFVPAVLYL